LVRSDPVAAPKALQHLYAQSDLTYADEIANLRLTYGRCLANLCRQGAQKGALLEIGCGNGFFLEEALAQGFVTVRGIEPSVAAVSKASPQVCPYIVCDVMHSGLFDPEEFDVVCLFQVLDHLHDPTFVLQECFRLLKPGGLILCLSHNVEALSARILKDHSPIFDIEHTFLYSPATMKCLFASQGYKIKTVGSVSNRYTLQYLMQLVPLPGTLKCALLSLLKNTLIGQIPLSVPLGNLYLVGQKPRNWIV
jgi:SAM-dependent methyltransferase